MPKEPKTSWDQFLKRPTWRQRLVGYLVILVTGTGVLLIDHFVGLPTRAVTVAYVAFLMGTVFELFRISNNLKNTALTLAAALFMSLAAFYPSRGERVYSFQSHLDRWPMVFALLLLLAMMFGYQKRLTARLTETTTMLHSVAFFFWVLDRALTQGGSFLLVMLALVPLAYTTTQLLTSFELLHGVRLGMSVWSAVVMVTFAIRYVMALLHMGTIETRLLESTFADAAALFARYVLLGVAGAYILQNIMMLARYMPGRRTFFNQRYFKEIRALGVEHVDRYSVDQISRTEGLVVIAAVMILLIAHWLYGAVSTDTVLWALLVGIPWTADTWAWWRKRRRRRASTRPAPA